MKIDRDTAEILLFNVLAVIFLLAVMASAGCVPPADPLTADAYLPALAVAIGVTSVATAPEPPNPDGGDCENCGGTGKVGDGTVFVDCVVCGGDGILDDSAAGGETKSPPTMPPAVVQPELKVVKPKLKFRTGSGDWCESCVALQTSIWANEHGIADLLDQFDMTTTKHKASSGIKVPVFIAEDGEMIGGPNIKKLVPWLQSHLPKETKDE